MIWVERTQKKNSEFQMGIEPTHDLLYTSRML